MRKTFLKFTGFELVERLIRFRLLLNECADTLRERSPGLQTALEREAETLITELLSHKNLLNRLFNENAASDKKAPAQGLDPALESIYRRLCELTRPLTRIQQLDIEAETYLFLKDALPEDLTRDAGEQSVFLVAEGEPQTAPNGLLPDVRIDSLSVLQKNNPLAWVELGRSFGLHLLETATSLEALRLDLRKKAPKSDETLIDTLLLNALNLRLFGPAAYFQAVAEAALRQDNAFLRFVEPALFYGLNHGHFTHKSLVILHEAAERTSSPSEEAAWTPLPEDTLAGLFRAVEKLVPEKAAFQEKHWERAVQLQERIGQDILLSSTALFPVDEVAEALEKQRDQGNINIYELLGMMTEYPHTPREIVNAGWLRKMERGPVWLYSILNESREEGFDQVLSLVEYQDHLLRKSIEVSEIHRVLLCTP